MGFRYNNHHHNHNSIGADLFDPIDSSNDPFTITNALTFSNCTSSPTQITTDNPTKNPTRDPSINPSRVPTEMPTNMPSKIPSSNPSMIPSSFPTESPTSATPASAPSTATETGVIDTTQTYAHEYEFITNDDISLVYFEAVVCILLIFLFEKTSYFTKDDIPLIAQESAIFSGSNEIENLKIRYRSVKEARMILDDVKKHHSNTVKLWHLFKITLRNDHIWLSIHRNMFRCFKLVFEFRSFFVRFVVALGSEFVFEIEVRHFPIHKELVY